MEKVNQKLSNDIKNLIIKLTIVLNCRHPQINLEEFTDVYVNSLLNKLSKEIKLFDGTWLLHHNQ